MRATREAIQAGQRGEATARQLEIMAYIRQCLRDKRLSPTLDEIGAAVGIKTRNGVKFHIDALIRKGLLLEREPGVHRACIPTDVDLPRCPCCSQPVPESD